MTLAISKETNPRNCKWVLVTWDGLYYPTFHTSVEEAAEYAYTNRYDDFAIAKIAVKTAKTEKIKLVTASNKRARIKTKIKPSEECINGDGPAATRDTKGTPYCFGCFAEIVNKLGEGPSK